MAPTAATIIGLCCVGIAAWAITCWSSERFLRVFLGVSVALHAALFAIPFAPGKSAPQQQAAAPTLIPYTIIQGSDAPVAADAEVEPLDEQQADDTIGLAHERAADLLDDDPIALDTKRDSPAPEGIVDAELPEIEMTAWFDFAAHPGAASYRKELQHIIQRHFEVPAALEERGYEGRLKVWLNLGRDGRLIYSFLDPTMRSEDDEINRLTEANLRKIADEFPPFPKGVKDYDVSFYVIIDYRNLRNR